ncbi:MAG TPA: NADH-quinone oxidoreductase subunit L [Anaerolineaceae bacterium]
MFLPEPSSEMQLSYLAPWVVFFPVIGIAINLLFGKTLKEKGIGITASLAAGASFLISAVLAFTLSATPGGGTFTLLEWIGIQGFQVDWSFRIDTLSVTMMLVVSGVGTLIHIYSIGYMHADVRHNNDPSRYRRFFVYLNLFIAAMMILVSANNYLMLFVGWEGVGLCSYLLIGFWYEKGKDGTGNALAGRKAFITNRIGDFGLLIALFLIFWYSNPHSLDFESVFKNAGTIAQNAPGVLTAITLFMLLGVAGKSAQLPLYVWLPDAMAGPTPVSALIHAATMVTAGVYLVVRSAALYTLEPAAQSVVMWIGTLTALFAATIALAQYDIKKVLAYSTISQLGFMVAAVGMGAYVAGIFHLVTHAFFKALLFLSAGSVILAMEHTDENAHSGERGGNVHHTDPQDMRNMGGLRSRMKVTFWVYLVGALALAGIAPLAGFFSKDEILAAASHKNPAVFVILAFTALLTAFYMGRQVFMIFFGSPRSKEAGQASESPAIVLVPLLTLALLSLAGGAFNFPGIQTLEHWLEYSFERIPLPPAEFIPWVAGVSLVLALVGILTAWAVYGRKPLAKASDPDPLSKPMNGVFSLLENKWWVDEVYQALILNPYQRFSAWLANTFDLGVIDAISAGLAALTRGFASLLALLQNGYARTYALVITIGVVLLLTFFFLR